jgi:hypothetical protein
MTKEIMLALGEYRFAVDSAAYQSLRRNHTWRWPAQERVGREPSRQFLGVGPETIDLSGVIYPHFKGGFDQVSSMKAEADQGEPLNLVDGMGAVWGKYCITELEETQQVFWGNGKPRKVEFRLKLARYGEDGAS